MMVDQIPEFPGDMRKAYNKLIDESFIRHNGCLIEILPVAGYGWGGKTYSSLQQAKDDIDITGKLNIQPPPHYYKTHVEVWIEHKDGTQSQLTEEQKEQYMIGRSPYSLFKLQQQ